MTPSATAIDDGADMRPFRGFSLEPILAEIVDTARPATLAPWLAARPSPGETTRIDGLAADVRLAREGVTTAQGAA